MITCPPNPDYDPEQQHKTALSHLGTSLQYKDESAAGSVHTLPIDSPIIQSKLQGKMIALYFGALWCPATRDFTPILAKLSNTIKSQDYPMAIVWVSHDNDIDSSNSYYREMPIEWFRLPFNHRLELGLDELFSVETIPALIILAPDGIILTRYGRDEVSQFNEGALDYYLEKYALWAIQHKPQQKQQQQKKSIIESEEEPKPTVPELRRHFGEFESVRVATADQTPASAAIVSDKVSPTHYLKDNLPIPIPSINTPISEVDIDYQKIGLCTVTAPGSEKTDESVISSGPADVRPMDSIYVPDSGLEGLAVARGYRVDTEEMKKSPIISIEQDRVRRLSQLTHQEKRAKQEEIERNKSLVIQNQNQNQNIDLSAADSITQTESESQ